MKSLLSVLSLIFVVVTFSVVAYNNYEKISTDGSSYSGFNVSSHDQQEVINFLNLHARENDIVYADPIFVFQLKCDTRSVQFVTNQTIGEATYVVVDPLWRTCDRELFYDIDIGTPRNWVTTHWIPLKTYGSYSIYMNHAVAGYYVVEAENENKVFTHEYWGAYVSSGSHGGAMLQSLIPNDKLTFTFVGKSIDLLITRKTDSGFARILIDNESWGNVDFYSPAFQDQVYVPITSDLNEGIHTIEVIVDGTKNVNSGGYWVSVDAFVVSGKPWQWTYVGNGIVSLANSTITSNSLYSGTVSAIYHDFESNIDGTIEARIKTNSFTTNSTITELLHVIPTGVITNGPALNGPNGGVIFATPSYIGYFDYESGRAYTLIPMDYAFHTYRIVCNGTSRLIYVDSTPRAQVATKSNVQFGKAVLGENYNGYDHGGSITVDWIKVYTPTAVLLYDDFTN